MNINRLTVHVYSVAYIKPMNIHSTPVALYNTALIRCMEFPVISLQYVAKYTHLRVVCLNLDLAAVRFVLLVPSQ